MSTAQDEAPRDNFSERALAEAMYLYDQERRKPLPVYSGRAIGLLAAIGILGFIATGFVGYPSDRAVLYTIFHPPWALFLWFAAAILLVQLAIFRQPYLKKWRWGTFAVTVVCIAGVAASYIWPDIVKTLSNGIVAIFNALGISLGQGRIVWNLMNFGLIALYLYDRVRLWASHRRAEYINFWGTRNSRRAMSGQEAAPPVRPARWELIAQDLFAGAALCAILGFVLQQDVLLNAVSVRLFATHIGACQVSWIVGACQAGGANNPPTLTSIDFHIAIFAGPASVLILAVGLIAYVLFQSKEVANSTVTRSVAEIISSVINPIDVVFRNLRNVVWPVLVFAGVLSAAFAARFIRLYLHWLSAQRTCSSAATCQDLKEFAPYAANTIDTYPFSSQALELDAHFLLLAVVGGAVAVLAILLAARVLASSRIPVSLRHIDLKNALIVNWVRFFFSSARSIMLVFWLFSLGLSGLMWALLSVNVTTRVPFPQPGLSTSISALFFLYVSAPRAWQFLKSVLDRRAKQ